jgi:uncharacterized protein YaiI (UPF0178 family)
MLELFIDADACPVKQETYRVARRYGLPVTVVANSRMHIPADPTIRLEIVGAGPDVADDWIAEHAGDGDIVVSADIPLAARCVERGAHVISPAGNVLTNRNIGQVLATRNLLSDLRDTGAITGGPPPFDDRARSRFLQALDTAINAIRRLGAKEKKGSSRDATGSERSATLST